MSNNSLDIFEVFQTIVREMEQVEKIQPAAGHHKKQIVMGIIREIIVNKYGINVWETQYRDMVDNFIEIVIILSKSNALRAINKEIRKCCF